MIHLPGDQPDTWTREGQEPDLDLMLTPCSECKEVFEHHLLRRHEYSGCLLCETCFSEYLEAYDETPNLFI